jgi:hypothetical protein
MAVACFPGRLRIVSCPCRIAYGVVADNAVPRRAVGDGPTNLGPVRFNRGLVEVERFGDGLRASGRQICENGKLQRGPAKGRSFFALFLISAVGVRFSGFV